jgi:hypothetical protein
VSAISESRRLWAPLRPIEKVSYAVGVVLMAAGVFHFVVFLVAGGSWEGPVSWRKPTTFGLSFGLVLISVTWVASYLVLRPRTRAWLLGIFAVDCVVEVLGISVQAWRKVPSHFNTSTPFDRTVAMSLAVGGAVLVVVLGTFAITAFRGRITGGPDLRLALQAGWAFMVLGLGTGIAMIAKGTVLYRTVSPEAAYTTAGALKPVHAVGLHALLVLALVAEVARLSGWSERRRVRAVAVAIGLYVLVTLVAVVMSLG